MRLLGPYRRIKRELFTLRQNLLSTEQVSARYAAAYHRAHGYGAQRPPGTWASDDEIKAAHASAILAVLPGIRKVLVGGCSSGMAVLAFRRLGVDAWGFDISPDLDAIVLPEVRSFVRSGSMIDIPFDRGDLFDCLVTTDVLEHVQLKHVGRLARELQRLQTPWMAHIINHLTMTLDHMTLKPLPWWEARFAHLYVRRSDLRAPVHDDPHIYGLNGDPDHRFTFWELLR
jgi:hypothetical protein